MCKQRSADAHYHRSKYESLELELEHVLAAGLGGNLVLSYSAQHPAPGGLDHLLNQHVQDDQDHQNNHHVKVVVVFRRDQVAQELGYIVEALGAVGRPLLVQEKEAHRLRNAKGSYRKVVVLEAQGDVADHEGDDSAGHPRGPEAQEEPQVDSQVQEGDFRPVAAEDEVLEQLRVRRLCRQQRRRIGAQREEAGYADVEQAGEAPVNVQPKAEHGVYARHYQETDGVVSYARYVHGLCPSTAMLTCRLRICPLASQAAPLS